MWLFFVQCWWNDSGIFKTTISSVLFYFSAPSTFFCSIYSSSLFSPLSLQATPYSFLFYLLSPSPSPSLHSRCMCPFIPPVSEGQVLTASWHLVRPAIQDCAVALCLKRQGRPVQVHYITPINSDWTQKWGRCMLMSGWLGLAHMPLIQEQMWSSHSWALTLCIPSLCPPHRLKPAISSQAMLRGPRVKQV